MTRIISEYGSILQKYISQENINNVAKAWGEPHRKYHNVEHLRTLLILLKKYSTIPQHLYHALVLSAFFHDVVYDPKRDDNEVESMKRFISSYNGPSDIKVLVLQCIEATKHRVKPSVMLPKIFWEADNAMFTMGIDELVRCEDLIRQEFSFVPMSEYVPKRVQFLRKNLGLFNAKADRDILALISIIEDRIPKK